MRLLALEAGGPVLSAALFDGPARLGSAWRLAPQRQTEQLAPLGRGLLDAHAWTASGLDAVACGLGPGSFTGLRSSLAFGRGLGLGVPGLRLVGVPTLTAWAEAFAGPGVDRVLVLLDGRRGQVYRGQLERRNGAWTNVAPPDLVDVGAARTGHRPGEAVISDLDGGALGVDAPVVARDSAALACAVGRLAVQALAAGTPLPAWEPQYLRRSEVEILWEKLHPQA